MNLSKFTDYGFRILICLGNSPDRIFTVDELASILNLSSHHIKKIVYKLSKYGYISSTKGRNGGIKLGLDPKDINLGKVLEITEDNLNLVECFSVKGNSCNISKLCKLKPIINDALIAFKSVFYQYTLQDVLDESIHI